MELQESNARKATEMYGNAVRLDPELWAAWANLGSVFHDQLNNHDEALLAYNQAYEILTEHDEPTDPPAEPRYILSAPIPHGIVSEPRSGSEMHHGQQRHAGLVPGNGCPRLFAGG